MDPPNVVSKARIDSEINERGVNMREHPSYKSSVRNQSFAVGVMIMCVCVFFPIRFVSTHGKLVKESLG